MAFSHYFWQKRMDKSDIKKGILDTQPLEVEDAKVVMGGKLYKIVYALLPTLPIFVLPLILVVFTVIIVVLSGSGTALFYAMVPLMVSLAEAASINPIALSIPMGLAGNLMRACSPVAAVILIVAGTTKQSPINIVKRTIFPSVIALVFMFVLSMVIYL